MKKIIISRGYEVIVDDEDFVVLNEIKWQSSVKSNTIYASNSKYGRIHRFLLNAKKGDIIDHIDGNGLNNQKSNLRFCTFQDNMRNKKTWGKIKYNGVSFVKKNTNYSYRCRITVNGKTLHLGYFKTELEAALEYNIKAKYYFNDFAKLNILY
jgi:hypothetical protein